MNNFKKLILRLIVVKLIVKHGKLRNSSEKIARQKERNTLVGKCLACKNVESELHTKFAKKNVRVLSNDDPNVE